jgi:signal transduction histidine kinase
VKRLRLRWRLALSHAVLALVLVAFAGNRINAQSRVASRAEATAGAERDADVLAARASRMIGRPLLLGELVEDENQGVRQAEVVSINASPLAGPDLAATVEGASTEAKVLNLGEPATSALGHHTVVAAAPVVVGSVLVGAALVTEAIPSRSVGFAAFGVSDWLGVSVVVVAALAGWFLAGRISRPIAALTDQARRLALGHQSFEAPSSNLPEVATLSAAIAGIATRETRRDVADLDRRRALRALTRRLSHQLRTPLTVLRLRLDDLGDADLPEDRRALLTDVVARQIAHLDQLGAHLAQLDPARVDLTRIPIELTSLVRNVVQQHAPLAHWGGVGLRLECADAIVVEGDPVLLEDATANVVQNAVKFTPRGGRVEVSALSRDHEAIVTVTDTGPGIRPGERELVWCGAVRGSAGSTTDGSGHGLGLVADAIDRHGGRIELGTAPGAGAVVSLVLPLR